ncbi:SET and MYND domain-containing protein 4 [Orchesella cincta]|uniref:SET and MYND domain-containing protein 4 n=1 Tax=Orchesella cincta TaxID=48709 RepID=A0A1D2MWU7_ORCCI|nr:SET and MYND domain-containing protein 4 [Orchesella cincta]
MVQIATAKIEDWIESEERKQCSTSPEENTHDDYRECPLSPDGPVDENGNTFAIALANRSAVYYELGSSYYDKSVKDADFALRYGYPERLKAKLLCRKASIYASQGKLEKAQKYLDIVKTGAMVADMENRNGKSSVKKDEKVCKKQTYLPPGIDVKIRETQKQIERLKIAEVSGAPKGECKTAANEGHLENGWKENPAFENASERIAIKASTSTIGRHVVAVDDIKAGDLLFKEEPFASVLLPEFYDSHCYHCHKSLPENDEYFLPCLHCSQVKFCDEICQSSSEPYHSIECTWLNLMYSVGIAHLAVRIVLTAGVDNILHCVKHHVEISNVENLEIFKNGGDNYRRVYSLLDHIDDMYEEDLFQYSLTASFLTRFLQTKTSFFQGISEDNQLKIGGAMLRHICQLVCNAHAITDVLPDTQVKCVVDENQKRIATAIFPAASIMNHSCNPNISFCNGKMLMVKASRAIKRNEDVYNCYGPHFRRMPRDERQEILQQQYFFDCSCDACRLELQTKSSFADQFQAFNCENCENPLQPSSAPVVQCPSCGQNQSMKAKFDMMNSVCDLMNKGQYFLDTDSLEAATEAFEACYKLAVRVLFRHNSTFGQVCDSLARCYVMAGKPNEAKKFLQHSLEYVKERFGEDSAEYNRELSKYESVLP